jgi:hypothetical protein
MGRAERLGMPPARETISGLLETAKRDLISLAFIPTARWANRFDKLSGFSVVLGRGDADLTTRSFLPESIKQVCHIERQDKTNF